MNDVNFETLIESFCDNYCRYPRICRDQNKSKEKCKECPTCRIIENLKQVGIFEEAQFRTAENR